MNVKLVMLWVLGLSFAQVGIIHFLEPGPFAAIVPPVLPGPFTIVYISGAIEILLGLLVLIPYTRRLAGLGLIALLIAVFPANVYAALYPKTMPDFSEWALWVRLPFQIVFLLWVWWCTQKPRVK